MHKNRTVLAIAFVALMSGGMIMAADDAPSRNAGPTSPGDATDLVQVDNVPQEQVTRYVHDQRTADTCTDNPFALFLADLLGMNEIMRPCEPTE